ncbi:MAG: oligosaccharide flippase family protein [Pseudomonadota bacterium]
MTTSVFRNSVVYLISGGLSKAIPFLLLPVLTSYLSPDSYGLLATALVSVELMVILIGLNIQAFLRVEYARGGRAAVTGPLSLGVLQVVALMTILSGLFLLIAADGVPWWLPFIAGFHVLPLLLLTQLQSEHRAVTYACLLLSVTLINAMASLYFVVVVEWDWEGRLLGIFLANLVGGLTAVVVLYRWGLLRLIGLRTTDYIRQLVYGVKLIPTALAWWARSGIDRYILLLFAGAGLTGLYAVGLQLALLVGLIAESINQATSPWLLQRFAREGRSLKVLLQVAGLSACVCGAAWLALIVVLPWIGQWLLGAAFVEALSLVPVLALAYVFHGPTLVLINALYLDDKVGLLSIITVAGALAHVVLALVIVLFLAPDEIIYALPISAFLLLVVVLVTVVSRWRGLIDDGTLVNTA